MCAVERGMLTITKKLLNQCVMRSAVLAVCCDHGCAKDQKRTEIQIGQMCAKIRILSSQEDGVDEGDVRAFNQKQMKGYRDCKPKGLRTVSYWQPIGFHGSLWKLSGVEQVFTLDCRALRIACHVLQNLELSLFVRGCVQKGMALEVLKSLGLPTIIMQRPM